MSALYIKVCRYNICRYVYDRFTLSDKHVVYKELCIDTQYIPAPVGAYHLGMIEICVTTPSCAYT